MSAPTSPNFPGSKVKSQESYKHFSVPILCIMEYISNKILRKIRSLKSTRSPENSYFITRNSGTSEHSCGVSPQRGSTQLRFSPSLRRKGVSQPQREPWGARTPTNGRVHLTPDAFFFALFPRRKADVRVANISSVIPPHFRRSLSIPPSPPPPRFPAVGGGGLSDRTFIFFIRPGPMQPARIPRCHGFSPKNVGGAPRPPLPPSSSRSQSKIRLDIARLQIRPAP